MNYILIGEMAAGKDTLAALMPGVIRLAFGDELRVIAKMLRVEGVVPTFDYITDLGLPATCDVYQKLADLQKYPKVDEKDRKLLQDLGTWARTIKDDIWISAIEKKVKPHNRYVITDCRRKSEFDSFKDFLSIYIEAPLEIRKQRIIDRDGRWDDEWPNHPAEREIRDLKWLCDFYIVNDGTVEDLDSKLKELLAFVERNKLRK